MHSNRSRLQCRDAADLVRVEFPARGANSHGLGEPRRSFQAHRNAELEAVTSPAFLEAIRSKGLSVVTYGDLARRGEPMSAPGEFGYSMTEQADE